MTKNQPAVWHSRRTNESEELSGHEWDDRPAAARRGTRSDSRSDSAKQANEDDLEGGAATSNQLHQESEDALMEEIENNLYPPVSN